MKDFRRTLNISYTDVTVSLTVTNESASAQCSSEDDLETSALLVLSIQIIVHVQMPLY